MFGTLKLLVASILTNSLLSVVAVKADFIPTEDYRRLSTDGWRLYLSPEYKSRKDLSSRILSLLKRRLNEIEDLVPPHTLPVLQSTNFWLTYDETEENRARYHPYGAWLAKNGYNPDWEDDISFSQTIESRLKIGPGTVLHELAHAYHHRALGRDNRRVLRAYDRVLESGIYDSVERRGAKEKKRHYALENPREYFAEMTEAYFSVNDYFPFTRAQLLEYDPETHDLIEDLWFGTK